MTGVDVAKVAKGAPVVAVDGDVFVEVANPLDVGLVVAAAVGVGASHVLAGKFGVDFVGTNWSGRGWSAGAD